MFLCWVTGLWLVFMGIAAAFAMPFGLRVMITVFLGLMAAVAVFMPWAAIYTNIEADTDAPAGSERLDDDPSIRRVKSEEDRSASSDDHGKI